MWNEHASTLHISVGGPGWYTTSTQGHVTNSQPIRWLDSYIHVHVSGIYQSGINIIMSSAFFTSIELQPPPLLFHIKIIWCIKTQKSFVAVTEELLWKCFIKGRPNGHYILKFEEICFLSKTQWPIQLRFHPTFSKVLHFDAHNGKLPLLQFWSVNLKMS